MKVLVIGLTENLGGIESYFNNYYNYLKNEITFDFMITTEKTCFEKDYIDNGSKIFKLKNPKINLFKFLYDFKKLLKNNKYDFIYFNLLSAANIFPFWIANRTKQKTIIHSHSSNIKKNLLKLVLHKINRNYIIKNATCCIACSYSAGKWFFKNRKFYIIHNAINQKKFKYNINTRNTIRKKLGIKNNDIVIGNVARFSKEKNHIFMIHLLEQINKEKKNLKLLLIGDGKLKEKIIKYASKKNLQNNIIFTGSINNTYDYYNAMDLFILPSYFEGLSLVAVEAQVNGLYCICSTNVSSETNISNLCKFINTKNIKEWKNYILNYKLTQNRKTHYISDYDIVMNKDILLNILKKLK